MILLFPIFVKVSWQNPVATPIQTEAATAQLPGFSGVPIKIPIMLADFPDKTKPGNSWAPLEGRLILLQRLGRVFSRNKKTCGMLGDST